VRLTYFHDNRLLTGLYKQETEIHRRKDEHCIKKQTNIDRHGTATISTSSQPLDPPHFSLPTTFNCAIVADVNVTSDQFVTDINDFAGK